MDVVPVLKALAKPLGVAALGGVIHLFVDGLVELTQHSRPVGVLVKLRIAFGKVCDAFEDLEIALDSGFEIWPLNLDRNLF